MKHIVTSSDNIQFVVDSHERSVAFDAAFASRQPAAVLEKHGDFTRVWDIDLAALLAPEPAPAPKARPKLTLIQGGKS